MKVYDWNEQLKIGNSFESKLDDHFKYEYEVFPVRMEHQKMGIDRFFKSKTSIEVGFKRSLFQYWFSVEYKTDFISLRSKCVFVETDIDSDGKLLPGWAVKSLAQVIVFLFPRGESGIIWWANNYQVKQMLPHWREVHGVSDWVENKKGPRAKGILVPRRDFFSSVCFNEETLTV